MRLRATMLALAVLVPLRAFAQTPAEPPPAAPPPAMPPPAMEPPPAAPPPAAAAEPAKTWKDLITMEGLVDAYYMWNFTGSTSQTTPQGSPAFTRSFDLNSNSFTMNYAKAAIGVTPEPVGLRLDVGYGAIGYLVNGANSGSNGQSISAAQFGANAASALLIEQAYVTAVFGNLTFDFGKFVTTAGAEVIEANKNWLYSRSILFGYIPLLHTGARATYKVNDSLVVQGSVVNGWNDLGFEGYPTSGKTVGFSINYTAPTTTNVVLTGYFGPEPDPSSATGGTTWRNLVDVVVAHTMGPLGLNLNFDYINQNGNGFYDNYFGIAAMGRYSVSDHLAVSLRGEFAQTGASGAKYKIYEGTLGLASPVGSNMEARVELRGDGASVPTGAPDNFDGGADSSVITATAAFLAWF